MVLASACGGGQQDPSLATAIEAWGLPAARPTVTVAEVAAGCDTVVIFVIDRVTKHELSFARVSDPKAPSVTPNLDAIAAGAALLDGAYTTSTAGNAAMASLLTGLESTRHGVATLRDNGRATLDDAHDTLAEVLQRQAWHTVATLASPRHARGFSGFSQGFDDYAAPRVGERPRSAASIVTAARVALDTGMRDGRKVFALYAFDGPGLLPDVLEDAPASLAERARQRLAPLQGRSGAVDEAVSRLGSEPAAALADIDAALRRARGSELANAWEWAQRDARLAAIDAAVGEVLAQLDEAGRGEHAMIAVVGLRGDELPDEPGADARGVGSAAEGALQRGLWLRPAVVQVPLALRYPCGAAAGLVDGPVSIVQVPRIIANTFGESVGPPERFDHPIICDGQLKATQVVTSESIYERHVDGTTLVFSRSDPAMAPAPLAPDEPLPMGVDPEASGLSAATRLWLRPATGAALHVVRWHVSDGQARALGPPDSAGQRPSARGSLDFGAGTEAGVEPRGLELSVRASAIRLEVGFPPGERPLLARIDIGGARASDLPLLLVPLEASPPLAIDAEPRVRLTRADGLWWTLGVAGDGPAELLVSVYPPRAPTDALEVLGGGAALVSEVKGRLDLVRIAGTAPFEVRAKKLGKESFAVACSLDGRFVEAQDMAFQGAAFGTDRVISFALYDWQPAFSDVLSSVDAHLYRTLPEVPTSAAVAFSITRSASGGAPGTGAALDVDGLEFVKRLLPGE